MSALGLMACVADKGEFFDGDPNVDVEPAIGVEPAAPTPDGVEAEPVMDSADGNLPVVVEPLPEEDEEPPPDMASPSQNDEPVVEEPEPPALVPGLVDPTFACPAGLSEFGEPELVTGLGLEGDLFGPVLSADGGTLVFSALAEDGDENIFVATREERGASFGAAAPLEGLDAGGSTEGTPFLSVDGLSLYFFSTREGPNVQGDRDIWLARRESAEAPFGEPVVVAEVNAPELDHLPWVSADNLTLMLVSTRPTPDAGASNIWVAERASSDEPFGAPVAVAGINTVDREEGFALSRDGLTLIFGSNRPGAQGMDLFVATRTDVAAAFDAPAPLGALNSPAEDIDASLSSDELELFFASNRNGPVEIFRSTRDCLSE